MNKLPFAVFAPEEFGDAQTHGLQFAFHIRLRMLNAASESDVTALGLLYSGQNFDAFGPITIDELQRPITGPNLNVVGAYRTSTI